MTRSRPSVHEAGHAVAAAVIGLPIESTTIVPAEGYKAQTRLELTPFSFPEGLLPLWLMFAVALQTMAGPVVEMDEFGDSQYPGGSHDDLRAALEILDSMAIHHRLSLTLRELHEHTVDKLVRRTPGFGRAVERVADALMEEGTLRGHQVCDIVSQCH